MRHPTTIVLALLLLGTACRSERPAGSSASTAPFRTSAEQIEHGREVYTDSCARCHGKSGEGSSKAPPLVGQGALPMEPRPAQKRKQPFHTALDVADFATRNMPPDEDDRAKLSERDYWAVLAFALSANGVDVSAPVGPTNAGGIVLHP